MQTGELCSREVYWVRPDEPLAEAAREMRKRHIGSLAKLIGTQARREVRHRPAAK